MKTCNERGCDRPIFGGGKCKYHQYRRYMRGGDLYSPKKKEATPIKKQSAKRSKEHKRYTEVCDELTRELREQNNGHIYCFFSGEEIFDKRPHYHHLKGRTGDHLIDKKWLVPAKDEYHVHKYHMASYEQRVKEWWWQGFLSRLKEKSVELWEKELRKADKAIPLNPKLEFEDDNDY